MAEQVAIVVLIAAGALLLIVPFVMTGVLSDVADLSGNPFQMAVELFLRNPLTLIGAFAALLVVVTVVFALHCFVQAGTVGIYLDSASTAPASTNLRDAFSAFSTDTFIAYGRRFWWPLFLIVNIIWGVFGILLLGPVSGAIVLFFRFNEEPEAVAWGCSLLALFVLLLIVVGVFATIWSDLSTALCVRRNLGVRDSLRSALTLMLRRFTDLLIVVVILVAISFGVSIVFAAIFGVIGIVSMLPIMAILTLPIQIVLSLLQSITSVFISCWFLAAVVAIVIDDEARSLARV